MCAAGVQVAVQVAEPFVVAGVQVAVQVAVQVVVAVAERQGRAARRRIRKSWTRRSTNIWAGTVC